MNNSRFPILYTDKSDCCGCRACEQICSQHAISMQLDNEGFLYPYLDTIKCINCRLCVNVCPIRNSDYI